jgi:hypothetical protein
MVGQAGDLNGGKERRQGLAAVPPGGETPLGISVDHGHGTRAGALGFDGQVGGGGGFARPALL